MLDPDNDINYAESDLKGWFIIISHLFIEIRYLQTQFSQMLVYKPLQTLQIKGRYIQINFWLGY